MSTFAVQYLENPYHDANPAAVRRRLRQAFERLPISLVLLGWRLSPALEEAVAEETNQHHAKLFRWQPLLTGDGQMDIPPEWHNINPEGNPIQGFGGIPEFTFICPNRSAVADYLSEKVEYLASSGLFQGLFLDRIRFPSPSRNPLHDLGCFCEQCTSLAADAGLDLDYVRRDLQSLPADQIVCSILGLTSRTDSPLDSFLDFRAASITRTISRISKQANFHSISIGLDCFSPALTRMVGQDLSAYDGISSWIKIMSYPRVFGPAGLPFELLGLVNWLIHNGLKEPEALQVIVNACRLPIPESVADLGRNGLPSETIAYEIQRASELGTSNILAGIALVKMKNIHESTPEQIQADLEASRSANGLVISWDLWLTPLVYLDTIRTLWG
jgi:hypothetical protein